MPSLQEPMFNWRSQRIFNRDLLKRNEEEMVEMSSKRKKIEQYLVNETHEMSSQKVQLHRSEHKSLILKHCHQHESQVKLHWMRQMDILTILLTNVNTWLKISRNKRIMRFFFLLLLKHRIRALIQLFLLF